MIANGNEIAVLLDESTPVLAAKPFEARGHKVIHHSEVCESGASDQVVVAMALLNKAILIAVDLDMKRYARRFGTANQGEKYPSLNLVFVGCNETLAAKRLAHAMSFIEHEWDVACQKAARRLWVSIDPHRLTSYR